MPGVCALRVRSAAWLRNDLCRLRGRGCAHVSRVGRRWSVSFRFKRAAATTDLTSTTRAITATPARWSCTPSVTPGPKRTSTGLEIDSEWVHLAPLLRSDFSAVAVAQLAARGHRVGYDGQGLVRVPQIGELTLDAGYDPEMLRHLTALKLSEDETAVVGARADARVRSSVVASRSSSSRTAPEGRRFASAAQ